MGSLTHSIQTTLRWLTTLALLAILAAALADCSTGGVVPKPSGEYWPTEGWRSTTPEAEGFDSAKLAEGLLAIKERYVEDELDGGVWHV